MLLLLLLLWSLLSGLHFIHVASKNALTTTTTIGLPARQALRMLLLRTNQLTASRNQRNHFGPIKKKLKNNKRKRDARQVSNSNRKSNYNYNLNRNFGKNIASLRLPTWQREAGQIKSIKASHPKKIPKSTCNAEQVVRKRRRTNYSSKTVPGDVCKCCFTDTL